MLQFVTNVLTASFTTQLPVPLAHSSARTASMEHACHVKQVTTPTDFNAFFALQSSPTVFNAPRARLAVYVLKDFTQVAQLQDAYFAAVCLSAVADVHLP